MAHPDTLPRGAYSVDEAARALGISRRTAFRHVASGALCTTKLGRRRLVLASELERLLVGSPEDIGSIEASQPPPSGVTGDAPIAAVPTRPAERPKLSELLARAREASGSG